jgi:regulator of protease activity HflC (stomatin/prohibitin superfamily)
MITQKRGKNVAIVGALVQLALAFAMLVIWMTSGSAAAQTAAAMMCGGVLVWLMTALLFYCGQLERAEAAEIDELRQGQGAGNAIFEHTSDRPFAARLAWVQKWLVPAFTLLWVLYLAGIGIALLMALVGSAGTWGHTVLRGEATGAVFSLPVIFASLLLGLYATSMSKDASWRLLRSPGSYLLVSDIVVVGAAVSLMASYLHNNKVDAIVAYIAPLMMVVLGLEALINLVMDMFRPRAEGEEYRPPYESRLAMLIADPGRVGHSIDETLNYQFGFEVSKTWFYQLAARAFIPLVLFGTAALVLMSCVVIVDQGEQYVVIHAGKAIYKGESDANRTLGPGIHFKLPWPIETAQRFDTGTVREVLLGVGGRQRPTIVNGREIKLWTQEHGGQKELDFLIGANRRSDTAAGSTPPPAVDIIKLVVAVRYRVADAYQYGYNFTEPDQILQDLSYREMTSYCASATLDTASAASPTSGPAQDKSVEPAVQRPEAIMTWGRQQAADRLKERIQNAATRYGLGVAITEVTIESAHPPKETADKFEEVLQADRRQDEQRYEAQAQANTILGSVAGDPNAALRLALAYTKHHELQELKDLKHDAKPAVLQARLADCVDRSQKALDLVVQEINREQLAGVSKQKAALKEDYQAYLKLLQGVKRGEVDFDKEIALARTDLDHKFEAASGAPAIMVAEARGYRLDEQMAEQTLVYDFQGQLMNYEACPEIYKLNKLMDMWDQVLPNKEKYVLGVDPSKVELYLDLGVNQSLMSDVTMEKPK